MNVKLHKWLVRISIVTVVLVACLADAYSQYSWWFIATAYLVLGVTLVSHFKLVWSRDKCDEATE